MKSHCDISGLPDLDEIKGELKNIDSHVFQSRSSSVGGPQLEINCSVDHKRDKSYIVLDKLYSAMDKPYNTSTIDDVKRYSIVHKPSYNVDKQCIVETTDRTVLAISCTVLKASHTVFRMQHVDQIHLGPFRLRLSVSLSVKKLPRTTKLPRSKRLMWLRS